MTAALCAFLITEVGVFSVTTSAKFRERYLFAITPLLALSFATYIKRRCPHRWGVFLISVALAITASRVPVSAYSTGASKFDSMTLVALEWVQTHSGVASTSFLVAGLLTAGGLWATVGALRGRGAFALQAAIALSIFFTAIATKDDLRVTDSLRSALPADLQWVDHTADAPVTAVATPLSVGAELLLPLYWNPDINRVVILDDASLPDKYADPRGGPGQRGELKVPPGFFLFDAQGTQAVFSNARLVTARKTMQLWHAATPPRYRTLVEGMWSDKWLIAGGRIRAWPRKPEPGILRIVRLSLTFTIPRRWPGTAIIALNGRRWKVVPGRHVHVVCSGAGHVEVTYRSPSTIFDSNLRPVSVRLVKIAPSDMGVASGHGHTTCRSA